MEYKKRFGDIKKRLSELLRIFRAFKSLIEQTGYAVDDENMLRLIMVIIVEIQVSLPNRMTSGVRNMLTECDGIVTTQEAMNGYQSASPTPMATPMTLGDAVVPG